MRIERELKYATPKCKIWSETPTQLHLGEIYFVVALMQDRREQLTSRRAAALNRRRAFRAVSRTFFQFLHRTIAEEKRWICKAVICHSKRNTLRGRLRGDGYRTIWHKWKNKAVCSKDANWRSERHLVESRRLRPAEEMRDSERAWHQGGFRDNGIMLRLLQTFVWPIWIVEKWKEARFLIPHDVARRTSVLLIILLSQSACDDLVRLKRKLAQDGSMYERGGS